MPSEPKKPIEQMLEALAKARRAQFGDDAKMPNPMRAHLHEEIARVGAADDEQIESRPSWITMFWPRLTVAAALATLLVLVPAILWNRSHQLAESDDVAFRDRASGAADRAVAKGPAASASEPIVNLADNSKIKVEPAAAASEAEALASESRIAQGGGATELSRQPTKDEIASAKIQSPSAAAPEPDADSKHTMAAAAPPVAQASSAGSLGTRQQFSQQSLVQTFRNNARMNRAANVLNTFQVEQQGNEIRIVDADGSTYTGKIEQSAKNAELDSRITARRAAAKQTRSYAAKAVPENEPTAPPSYFRATGYNVSLKKRLVFEGNYADAPTQQSAIRAPNDKERAEQNRDRSRIVATVRVNGDAPIEVDAVADAPEPTRTKKSDK